MTPGARLSAAMALLDDILAGAAAERVLTRWARASRFAGSKDRAAVRDLVYDGLRCRRSFGWRGGADSGRGIVLGGQAQAGADLDALCDGERFSPSPLRAGERAALARDPDAAPEAVRLDVPDFALVPLRAVYGAALAEVLGAMRARAPVDLRVNTLKTTRNAATVVLARDGVQAMPLAGRDEALRVTENPRLVQNSRAYSQGMVELQDISSQQAAAFAGAAPGMTVLDYCAGGGGKALALAAAMQGAGRLMAWDRNARRMRDLPARAGRAGARIEVLEDAALAALGPVCDVVFVDAPCSGSGAWRRQPEAKWRLTPERLAEFAPLQNQVLDAAMAFVRPGGALIYATCSLFESENEARVAAFLARHPDWRCAAAERLDPRQGGDGFYMARLERR